MSELLIQETCNGLGLHLLAVTPEQIMNLTKVRCLRPRNSSLILTSTGLLFEAPTFQLAVMLNQLSLLFLYRRVFTLAELWFKSALYAIGIFYIGSGIGLFFTGLFHCVPLKHGWNLNIPGHCGTNVLTLYITATALNLFGDISIVAAPMPLIWSLRMSLPTKAALTGMFLLGGL